jgi:type IV fimbrial biogenesis protein FimT
MEDGWLIMMTGKRYWAAERESGFTLVELLMAVIIIVILSAIAVPTATTWLPNYYLRNAAMDIFSNMQFAKTEAVRHNSPYAVVFDSGNNRFSLVSGPGADGVFGTGGDDVVVRTVNLSHYGNNIVFGKGDATINFDDGDSAFPGGAVSFTNNAVVFDSRGMCNAGSVYLENPNRIYAVGTFMSGVLRVATWGGGSWH